MNLMIIILFPVQSMQKLVEDNQLFSGRRQLEKIIPGLRPWEVLSVEQAMDQITYGGEWYREPLGSYTTGPPYISEWNKDFLVCISVPTFAKYLLH